MKPRSKRSQHAGTKRSQGFGKVDAGVHGTKRYVEPEQLKLRAFGHATCALFGMQREAIDRARLELQSEVIALVRTEAIDAPDEANSARATATNTPRQNTVNAPERSEASENGVAT